MSKGEQKNNSGGRGNAKRSTFLKYYFSEKISGKPNHCFGNARKSALKVRYSNSYARQILGRIEKQNNPEGEKVAKVRKGLQEALEEQGVNADWLGKLVYRLGSKTDKRVINKKLVDTGDPDSQGARTALDFIAKTQGMYEPERHSVKFDSYSKDQLVELIIGKIGVRR